MNFSYNHDYDYLTLHAYKVDVKIWFKNGGPSHIEIDECEFYPKSDVLYGVFVQVRKPNSLEPPALHSLQDVMDEAERQYEDIVAETEEEAREEQALADELSSVYLTGRI